ncbi:MAG: hypothetical protein IJ640_11240 [Prevotella sp.]|nr:hypothetical protein [Prevotella sp.]
MQTSENIIIIDADYVDNVAFDLTVNFERMLERRIDKADLPLWLDCVALDGGLREGENSVQVVLIHEKGKLAMDNFMPDKFEELTGKAFKDHLGEFAITAVQTEDMAPKGQLLCDVVKTACALDNVKRIVIVPDTEYYNDVRNALRQADDEKRITVLAMQPMPGGNFKQEILGYSLMQALGIRSDEIRTDN